MPASTAAAVRKQIQAGTVDPIYLLQGEDEVEKAGRIIAAFEEAEADGRGVVTVDGRMIENLHVEEARRVLAIQAAISALTAEG